MWLGTGVSGGRGVAGAGGVARDDVVARSVGSSVGVSSARAEGAVPGIRLVAKSSLSATSEQASPRPNCSRAFLIAIRSMIPNSSDGDFIHSTTASGTSASCAASIHSPGATSSEQAIADSPTTTAKAASVHCPTDIMEYSLPNRIAVGYLSRAELRGGALAKPFYARHSNRSEAPSHLVDLRTSLDQRLFHCFWGLTASRVYTLDHLLSGVD